MAKMYSFGGLVPDSSDLLEYELEKLRFQIEHPEEWKKEQERRKKEAAEFEKKKEDAKNLPEDYFDGWDVYVVQKDESLVSIGGKMRTEGKTEKDAITVAYELLRDNERQLPDGARSVYAGMKLRIGHQMTPTLETDKHGELYRLEHEDLVNLLCGTNPYQASTFLNKTGMSDLITISGGPGERYEWNRKSVRKLSEMEIYSLYLSLREL